ncbi:MAG: hypothetical protein OXF20_07665 [Gammaproteobacteria bacterium]|nr:hypothetical protein [Gammaproteobacteria bacterium]
MQGFERPPINTANAWVGLSKALHFINSRIFPIWDSRVANNFNVAAGNQGYYICYIEWCHSVLDPGNKNQNAIDIRNAVNEVRNLFVQNVGYGVSKIRALEFILFVMGKILKNAGNQAND